MLSPHNDVMIQVLRLPERVARKQPDVLQSDDVQLLARPNPSRTGKVRRLAVSI
jgi:hypothetical protein